MESQNSSSSTSSTPVSSTQNQPKARKPYQQKRYGGHRGGRGGGGGRGYQRKVPQDGHVRGNRGASSEPPPDAVEVDELNVEAVAALTLEPVVPLSGGRSPLGRSRSGEEDECPICIEPIEFWNVGTCNHRKICAICSLRRRVLYSQSECPLCRQNSDYVVMTKDSQKPFETFDLNALSKSKEFKIYFDKDAQEYFSKLTKLWELKCPYCDKTDFKSLPQLKGHVKEDHHLQFCNVCLQDRKVFLQEQKLYSQKDLKLHQQYGDKDTQVHHESCEFCKQYFYDKDKLYEHLNTAHETCFLCERNGKHYQYYKDYPELEKHFRADHYLCEESECLQQKFIVFNNEMDIKLHEVEKHLANRSGTRSQKKNAAAIKLDINVRSGATSRLVSKEEENSDNEEKEKLDVTAHKQFPSLEGQQPVTLSPPMNSSRSWGKNQKPEEDNFPSLPSQKGSNSVQNIQWGQSIEQLPLPSQSRLSEMDSRLRDPFPSLGTRTPVTFVNMSWGKPQLPQTTPTDFPSLPIPSPTDNFPSLSSSSQKKKKQTTVQPITSVWGSEKKSGTSQESNGGFGDHVIVHYGNQRRKNRRN